MRPRPTELQIATGHSGKLGCWVVELGFGKLDNVVKFDTRDQAYHFSNAVKLAFKMGREDMQKELRELLGLSS